MTKTVKSYTTAEGLRVTVRADGRRTINGLICGVSSLSDLELAACNDIVPMPPLDSPCLPGIPLA